jgi:hypothetical protein
VLSPCPAGRAGVRRRPPKDPTGAPNTSRSAVRRGHVEHSGQDTRHLIVPLSLPAPAQVGSPGAEPSRPSPAFTLKNWGR